MPNGTKSSRPSPTDSPFGFLLDEMFANAVKQVLSNDCSVITDSPLHGAAATKNTKDPEEQSTPQDVNPLLIIPIPTVIPNCAESPQPSERLDSGISTIPVATEQRPGPKIQNINAPLSATPVNPRDASSPAVFAALEPTPASTTTQEPLPTPVQATFSEPDAAPETNESIEPPQPTYEKTVAAARAVIAKLPDYISSSASAASSEPPGFSAEVDPVGVENGERVAERAPGKKIVSGHINLPNEPNLRDTETRRAPDSTQGVTPKPSQLSPLQIETESPNPKQHSKQKDAGDRQTTCETADAPQEFASQRAHLAQDSPAPQSSSSQHPTNENSLLANTRVVILQSPDPADRRSTQAPDSRSLRVDTHPAASTAPTLPGGPVHIARLFSNGEQTEMHVALRTGTFGNVEVRTTIRGDQVGITFDTDKNDLHTALAANLPSLAASVHHHDLKLESVQFVAHVSAESGFSSTSQQENRSPQRPPPPVVNRSVSPMASSAQPEVGLDLPASHGLSIHA